MSAFSIQPDFIRKYGPEMGPGGIAVFTALCCHADENGRSFPSLSTLGRVAGMSEDSARRHIRRLVKMGIVTSETRMDKGQRSNLYTLQNGFIPATRQEIPSKTGVAKCDSAIDRGSKMQPPTETGVAKPDPALSVEPGLQNDRGSKMLPEQLYLSTDSVVKPESVEIKADIPNGTSKIAPEGSSPDSPSAQKPYSLRQYVLWISKVCHLENETNLKRSLLTEINESARLHYERQTDPHSLVAFMKLWDQGDEKTKLRAFPRPLLPHQTNINAKEWLFFCSWLDERAAEREAAEAKAAKEADNLRRYQDYLKRQEEHDRVALADAAIRAEQARMEKRRQEEEEKQATTQRWTEAMKETVPGDHPLWDAIRTGDQRTISLAYRSYARSRPAAEGVSCLS